ncbi:hypothetical protein DU500_16645 [Haloplanus rubicundus]|uniref:DUF7344 domain-containing protein n=1 Tax=Haloplanus rubicundus TaxID=1547898 RepID=A0A345E6V3_9EURY|nr:hypothetical protein [Haloplanus rubicundus]AXG07925.1 hypothetical protein DU500_16645 [Haloplanus rubicundus]
MAEDRITRDAAFSLLSNRRRRQLLCVLARSGEARSLRAAAREIVGRLEGIDSTEITDEVYRSVYVSLYQTHAPQLAAEGIVDYDETERTVRLAHNRRTETLLRIVGIDPNGADTVDRRTALVLTGAVVVATLCGLFALFGAVWTVPWAALVAGLLAYRVRQHAGRDRLAPIHDCGDLATSDDS